MWKVLIVCVLVTCVVTTPVVDNSWRVVGGTNAAAGAFPQVVSLRSPAHLHFCGGSILNSVNILTSAYCLAGRTVANTITVAGTHLLDTGGQIRTSTRFILHAGYNSLTLDNDIAVVRLTSGLAMGGLTQQVSLNTVTVGPVAAILAGWGQVSAVAAMSNILQQLNTQAITNTACQTSWGTTTVITPLHICTFTQAGQGACQGDFGGPLFLASDRIQIGIASFRHPTGCATTFPDVYTRVNSYINWIATAVNS